MEGGGQNIIKSENAYSEIESDSLSAAYSDAVSVAFDEVTIEAGPGEGLELLLLTEHEETGFSGAIEMIAES